MIPSASTAKLTYDDYCLIPEDGQRHEIIDGIHYVAPAPGYKHQQILANLYLLLGTFVRDSGIGKLLFAPFDIVLSEHDVVQPDILFVASGRLQILNARNIQGAPNLLIEALSPSNRRHDEIRKRELYEQFGVKEYWIVDPESETVKVYRLEENTYGPPALFGRPYDVTLETPLLPGFELVLGDVFAISP